MAGKKILKPLQGFKPHHEAKPEASVKNAFPDAVPPPVAAVSAVVEAVGGENGFPPVEPPATPVAEVAHEAPVEPVQPEKKRAAFKVTAIRPQGFWALKRRFAYNQPEILLADELTKEQIADLLSKSPQALLVEPIEV